MKVIKKEYLIIFSIINLVLHYLLFLLINFLSIDHIVTYMVLHHIGRYL